MKCHFVLVPSRESTLPRSRDSVSSTDSQSSTRDRIKAKRIETAFSLIQINILKIENVRATALPDRNREKYVQ